MNDTISAATAWGAGDARLNFLDAGDFGPAPGPAGSHIPGSAYTAEAPSPGLVVNFMSLTPDASGWGNVIGLDQAAAPADLPPTVSGYASMPDVSSPVIVGALSSS